MVLMIQFLTRFLGSDSKPSRFQGRNRSPGRHRAAICVEFLEGRKLLSGDIPGVSAPYGALTIQATQSSHNVAQVATNPATGGLEVSLNGQTEEFAPGAIWTISYKGGQFGSDSFTNNTNVQDSVTMFGGNNTVLGGSNWNTVNLYGNNNTYDARNGASYVFTYGGPNDNIVPSSNESVFAYSYDPESLYF
jgi:hypothetical protein